MPPFSQASQFYPLYLFGQGGRTWYEARWYQSGTPPARIHSISDRMHRHTVAFHEALVGIDARGGEVRPYASSAALNQLVRLVGCVMAVPTTTAQAPASMAARPSAGVCTCPSQMMGSSGNSAVA